MNYKVSETDLTSVANAIRTKGGTSAGLSFPDGFVTAIGNIPTGTQPTLITKNISENGTYNASSDSADGYSSVTVYVSGGNSNIITGTFTAASTDEGTAIAVTIPYAGSGYPVAGIIYPTYGTRKSGTTVASSLVPKSITFYSFAKNDTSVSPDYTSGTADENRFGVLAQYKYSTTDPDSYSSSQGRSDVLCTKYAASGNSAQGCMRFKDSSTNMLVWIKDPNDSNYGFFSGVEYTYLIIYSS